ncbi:MAG TPA: alpha/beta fold hydrolase [Solirubrobacteraceae bacterium]|jgi:pimeloyl-ACP methyl ester carboxylesterase|nr:alpha/beta fold hydrolase [Solirubrobacteraceae bacterium]
MRRSLLRLIALLASLAALGPLATDAHATPIAYVPCARTNNFACAHLAVPLDPSGATPGTIALAIRRHRAAVGEARSAIVALAGGPGQAAITFAEDFAETLGPIAATRDLIVFDQRGTGLSHPLQCKALAHVSASTLPARAVAACASQLGPSRAFYTTADSVADIEAIRRAGGYEKLILYGTSYGTKVAEEYAEAYPDRVEGLILDSVVPPNGPEALNQATFAAIPRVLRGICARKACRGVTTDPVRDLSQLLRRIHRRRLRTQAISPEGKARPVTITAPALLDVLLAGDFSGALRATLLSTVRSAALGDLEPLGRLLEMLPGEGEAESEGIDIPLYYATSCEEQQFPWNRASTPERRVAEAVAAARALPSSQFAPFDAADAVGLSNIPECAAWPYVSPLAPQPLDGPLPAVPTLILSGGADLRTPTSGARAVAALIGGSHVLVVPMVGHSVLGSDPTSCAARALQALFAGKAIHACRVMPTPLRLRPEPLPPPSLAHVRPVRGYSGRPGRTARALQLTVEDLARQLFLRIEASGEEFVTLLELRVGGLRSGWARLSAGGVSFHDYSFIPGMTLSGSLRSETADLHIGGPAAADGTLHLGPHHMLVGTLGGLSVRVTASAERATAIVGADAEASSATDPGDPAGDTGARRLARVLERLL